MNLRGAGLKGIDLCVCTWSSKVEVLGLQVTADARADQRISRLQVECVEEAELCDRRGSARKLQVRADVADDPGSEVPVQHWSAHVAAAAF